MAAWRSLIEELLRERRPALIGYATLMAGDRAVAENLVHDAIIRTFGMPRSFPSLQVADTSVRGAIASAFIRRARSTESMSGALRQPAVNEAMPDETIADRLDLRAAVRTLPPHQRACVVMRSDGDTRVKDIAGALGVSEDAVKGHLSDGIRRLNTALGADADPDAVDPAAVPPRESGQMSADLVDRFDTAMSEEIAAASREFPMTEDEVHTYVRTAGRRRLAVSAMLALGGIVVVGGFAFGAVRFWPGPDSNVLATSSPSLSATPSESASPSPTGVPPSVSASPSATANSPVPTETTAATPDPPNVDPPAQVTSLRAGSGGGSGEVLVSWEAVEGATGYSVYRASSPDGDFVRSASIDVDTGATHIYFGGSYENIQIWRPSSTSFEYVEAIDGQAGYFKVVAFNEGGNGPNSEVVCSAPFPNSEGC